MVTKTIHTSREALAEPGVVQTTTIELSPFDAAVVLTVKLSTPALADALYHELIGTLRQSVPFRIGDLALCESAARGVAGRAEPADV
jgi:hypothetical protein